MMPMSLGLGLGLIHGGAANFNPLSLFAVAEGAWYDFTDTATLFQDAARTTPVTASGQAVGGVTDKSGKGNHLTQATSSRWPVYTVSGGLSFLQFDGADDYLDCAALAANWTGLIEQFAAIRTGAGGSLGYPTSGLTSDNFNLRTDNGAGVTHIRSAGIGFTPSPVIAASTDYLLTVSSVDNATTIDVNGQVSGTLDPGTSTVSALRVGARADGAQRHAGRMYGMIIVNATLSAGQRAATKTWLGAKAGLTL
jgi:hypothetical protein